MTASRLHLRRWLVLAAVVALASCGDDERSAGTTGTSASSTSTSTTTTSLAVTTTTALGPPPTANCGTVGFTPNSEDAASDIRATGVTCGEAIAFVRQAGRRTSSGGPASLEVEGFTCKLTSRQDDPLPAANYECRNGAKVIRFLRS